MSLNAYTNQMYKIIDIYINICPQSQMLAQQQPKKTNASHSTMQVYTSHDQVYWRNYPSQIKNMMLNPYDRQLENYMISIFLQKSLIIHIMYAE